MSTRRRRPIGRSPHALIAPSYPESSQVGLRLGIPQKQFGKMIEVMVGAGERANDNNVYSVVFQTSTPSGAPSYVIPSDGVITSWSFRADGPPPINSAPSTRA